MLYPDFSRMSRAQFDATYLLASMSTKQLAELKQAVDQQLAQANDVFLGCANRAATELPIDRSFNEKLKRSLETVNTLQEHGNAIMMLEFERTCEETSIENTVRKMRQLGI